MLNALVVSALLLSRLDSPVSDRADALAKEVLKLGNDPRGAAALIRLHSLIDDLDDLNILAEPYSSLIYRQALRFVLPYPRQLRADSVPIEPLLRSKRRDADRQFAGRIGAAAMTAGTTWSQRRGSTSPSRGG